eukprot:CAMPEP_0171766782 /NCGR_PEP_ID=MMETSP0991-20121206/51447_1 /TAXON_ID=483369 /ORGANISM="non described non described, Strain CCMP2098" /LENGTH=65 /DNA_ID=CAMNT_0012371483 /DNA_START=203 /DNA_END=396 /DNA_ORIENTATION=+
MTATGKEYPTRAPSLCSHCSQRQAMHADCKASTQISSKSTPMSSSPPSPSIAKSTAVSLMRAVSG